MSKTHVISFIAPINPQTVSVLQQEILNIVSTENIDEFCIKFSSTGGNLNAGFQLYSFLRSMKTPITMINTSNVDSIAVIVYLAAQKRYALSNSKFLLHGFDWTFPSNNVGYAAILESYTSLNAELKRYVNVYKERTDGASKPIDVSACLSGNPSVLSDADAVSAGISHKTIPYDFADPNWASFSSIYA